MGQFKPSEDFSNSTKYPELLRDAKFGFWAHWGPQAVFRQGDLYARKMYQEGSDDYKYHVAHCPGYPATDATIHSLGKDSKISEKETVSVTMLGSHTKLNWKQEQSELVIIKPAELPVRQVPVVGFKIEFK